MTITYEQFALDCCAALGCPANQAQQIDTLVTVFTLEDSKAAFNPEDTEEPEPGATDYNPQGVKDYPTLGVGLAAFKATITEGAYPEIVKMLRAGDDASRVLASPEWDTWAGQPITHIYAEMLAAVRNDRAAYYGRSIGEGVAPQPSPTPSPVGPVPTPTSKETTLSKIVIARDDTAVYLVGGVPVVRQHIDNELTQFLLSIGYEIQRDVDATGLALVPLKTEAPAVAVAVPELVPPQVMALEPPVQPAILPVAPTDSTGGNPTPLTGGNSA